MEIAVVAEKHMLGLKIPEGKNPISLEAYEFLAKTLFKIGEKRDIFARIFLVLYWCLTKRAENCVNTKINHINFHGDCPVFELAKYKGHKNGEKCLGPWHVYENPPKMCSCTVL